MALTAKQEKQLAKTPGPKKAALRAAYLAQNAASTGKPAPKPKKAAVRQQPKPQHLHNFLDPMCPIPAPAVTSDGRALPHTGLDSYDFKVDAVNTTILLATNTGSSGTVATIFKVTPTGGILADTLHIVTLPTLAAADSAGGASSSRAMKFSVSVVNCTNNLKRGGRVTYINSAQRFPTRGSDAATAYQGIVDAVKASPYRRRINGNDLATPKQLIGFPVDGTAYRQFEGHHGTLSATEFFGYVLTGGPTVIPERRAMSTVAFVFDPVTDEQDYSVTIRAAYYTRWPLTSVPGQKMEPMPTADAKHINIVHDHAEEMANNMVHVAEGGIMATVAPKVAGAVRSLGSSALGRVATAAEGAIAEAGGAGVLAETLVPMLL